MSNGFEMTRMSFRAEREESFPLYFHALDACVKLMNHFVVNVFVRGTPNHLRLCATEFLAINSR